MELAKYNKLAYSRCAYLEKRWHCAIKIQTGSLEHFQRVVAATEVHI